MTLPDPYLKSLIHRSLPNAIRYRIETTFYFILMNPNQNIVELFILMMIYNYLQLISETETLNHKN